MPIDVKNLNVKNLNVKNLPKPAIAALAGVAVLIGGGVAFGLFYGQKSAAPTPPPSPPGPSQGMPSDPRSSGRPPAGQTPPGRPGPAAGPTAAPVPDTPEHRVAALVAHLQQHPDIARVSYQATNVDSLDVKLRAGITDAQAVDVAKRIRRYMAATYPDFGEMIVVEIFIHRQASDDARLRVEQQIDEKAATHAWHVIVDTVNGPNVLE